MIKLDVQDYCQECPFFEAKTVEHILFPGDTTITCKSADRCRWAIMESMVKGGANKLVSTGKMEEEPSRACAIGSYTQLVNGGIREQPCNGDVIRAMNNERLAKWLNTVEFNWYFDDPIRNWIDQPAKKEEWGRFWPW